MPDTARARHVLIQISESEYSRILTSFSVLQVPSWHRAGNTSESYLPSVERTIEVNQKCEHRDSSKYGPQM